MAFHCPNCSTAAGLRITRVLELPADSRSDEISLQLVKCAQCRFEAIAVYEESRRGRLGSESVDHYGYFIGASDLNQIKRMIAKCPNPRRPLCPCESHEQLGRRDKSGRWNGLAGMELGQRFVMKLG